MISFVGKRALITGASGTIGSSIVRLFDSLGCDLIITGTNKINLQKLNSTLTRECEIMPCNFSNEQECLDLMNSITKIDILICNAGITHDMLAIKMKTEDFDRVMQINLKSVFILNRESIKKMLKERYGRIINISSIVAVSGNPGQANYCASKAGLIGMSKSLALEVANKGICINVIAPGFVESNMTDKLNEAQKNLIKSKIPVGRFGNAKDVANITAFYASDLASYVTGQTIHVNGGMLMV